MTTKINFSTSLAKNIIPRKHTTMFKAIEVRSGTKAETWTR